MSEGKGLRNFLRKQPAMRRVLAGLSPCLLGGIYFFGWRTLAAVLFCILCGFIAEYVFCRRRNQPVSEAVVVTGVLFGLVMPPGAAWHVMAVGMFFAIVFSKEVFGGFGRNIFNPALAGRCFVYICFPVALTGMWLPAASGPLGALGSWTSGRSTDGSIAVTGASPMAHLKAGRIVLDSSGEDPAGEIPFEIAEGQEVRISRGTLYKGLVFGRISGTAGVTSALLILIGGMYLFITKTASRTTILSVVISYAVLNQVLYWFGVKPVPGALPAVLGGGFLFGAFFMATDPVSSPKTEAGRVIYGLIIALSTTVIRNFSIFNGGLMFSILLGNMFAPIIDYAVFCYQGKGQCGKSLNKGKS